MAGGDFQDAISSRSAPKMKCTKYPSESVRKVYSRLDGSAVRTMCAECLFQDPEFVQANKASLYDLPSYLDKLSQIIQQDKGNVENLRKSVPNAATEFLDKGTQISDVFSQFSLVEFTKLRNLVMMHTDKIRDMVELMIQGYKHLFDEAEATVKKNVEHVMNEIELRYQLTSNISELDRDKLVSLLESSENPSEYLRKLEYQLQPTQFDKSCIDAYIGTLLHKSEKVLETPPKVSLDSGLELKLNQLVKGVAGSLAEIDAHIKSEVLHNVKISDLSKEVSFKPGLWKAISGDGLCGKYDFAEEKKIQLKLANKILSTTPAVITCLSNTPEWGLIAAGSADGKVVVYNTDLAEAVGVFGNHKDKVTALVAAKTSDSKLTIISGCAAISSPIQIAKVSSLAEHSEPIREVTGAHLGGVTSLCVIASPQTKISRWIVSGGSDGSVSILDLQSKSNTVVFKTKEDQHSSAVIAIKEASENRIITAGKNGILCLWNFKCSNQTGSDSFTTSVDLELVSKIDRKQTIQSIFCRSNSETDVQVVILYQGSKVVEVIDMGKLILEKQFELPAYAENLLLVEHLYKDGRLDFVLLDTAVPGEPIFLGDTTNPRFNLPIVTDPSFLSQGVAASQPAGPRVQFVQLNKKSLRVAKIAPTTLGVSCINFYDLVQV